MINERLIIQASTQSTEFLDSLASRLEYKYFESALTGMLMRWILQYYEEYKKSPGKALWDIYFGQVRLGQIEEEAGEELQQDILPYIVDTPLTDDVDVITKEAMQWLELRKLELIREELEVALDKGDLVRARTMVESFERVTGIKDNEFSTSNKKSVQKVIDAFNVSAKNVIRYPGALGRFWNNQLVRGALIGILAPEKRGKTFTLIDMAMRALHQGRNVAFFQAGDMTEAQWLLRVAIYLAKKSNKKKWTGKQLLPVRDCVLNQLNLCQRPERTSDFGVFEGEGLTEDTLRREITFQRIMEEYDAVKSTYVPCQACEEVDNKRLSTIWYKEVDVGEPLDGEEAAKIYENAMRYMKGELRVKTYANGTLSLVEMKRVLKEWKSKGFQADVILLDYADLMEPPKTDQFRHGQNAIWKGLRAISQEEDCLLVSPTQADASSYKQDTLNLSNYSEDKRKYAHVTAMYGLNQDKEGREKKLRIMRINELILREDEFDSNSFVYVLQGLNIGRPILTSYF